MSGGHGGMGVRIPGACGVGRDGGIQHECRPRWNGRAYLAPTVSVAMGHLT